MDKEGDLIDTLGNLFTEVERPRGIDVNTSIFFVIFGGPFYVCIEIVSCTGRVPESLTSIMDPTVNFL